MKLHNYVMGVDPGASGAYCIIDEEGAVVEAHSFDTYKVGGKTRLDVYALLNRLRLRSLELRHSCVEEVGPMPKQGVSSTFQFGRSYGQLEAVLVAIGTPVMYVRPAVWKAHMAVPRGSDKDYSRVLASRLSGGDAHWPLKKHHGVAEAYLIARYCKARLERNGS